ncbi:hypothetical protein SCHPADRAFT_701066 [Schizopora paradoxa]|uniref:Uncharacterized protein n=1 Tax=Schizopora paradoxa TaxID=27342 RepID=A0A0H2R426_9AGAM|nr:hypothetical protein SCHPADRAFT_701066 [Schizopora paradoxa]
MSPSVSMLSTSSTFLSPLSLFFPCLLFFYLHYSSGASEQFTASDPPQTVSHSPSSLRLYRDCIYPSHLRAYFRDIGSMPEGFITAFHGSHSYSPSFLCFFLPISFQRVNWLVACFGIPSSPLERTGIPRGVTEILLQSASSSIPAAHVLCTGRVGDAVWSLYTSTSRVRGYRESMALGVAIALRTKFAGRTVTLQSMYEV